jgi:hypothetical protein
LTDIGNRTSFQYVTVNSSTPSAPVISATGLLPLAGGNLTGALTITMAANQQNIKLDHAFSDRNRISGFFYHDFFEQRDPELVPGPTTPNRVLTAVGFDYPAGVVFDAAGNLWLTNASFTPAKVVRMPFGSIR